MAKIKVIPTALPGFVIIEPAVFIDARGYFMESYNEQAYTSAGITARFVQDNESVSARGTLRGLHFQTLRPQDKLVRVISGAVLDVAVDLRKGSKTFGKWDSVVLSGENKRQAFIPKGFAHGFAVLSYTAVFSYKCSDFYDPSGEGGILWNDPALSIDWQLPCAPILSQKDLALPTFAQALERGVIVE